MTNEPSRLQLIGEHPAIAALRELIARVGRSQASTILIYGETGTGKSLVARMLHAQSNRAAREFIDINCAAIPGQLLESELFGHERGSFTGAVSKKEGLIEAANGGTVFLDEVRELDPVMQSKILTLLDTRRFRRVGAVRPISVDVRFIAATNKILLSEVKAGKFREDLYYRLQVIAINIPPLRERGDDIFLLASNALTKYNAQYGSRIQRLDPEVERIFRAYRWPGNVRELENLLERICLLEEGDCIRPDHLPARILRDVMPHSAEPDDPASLPATMNGALYPPPASGPAQDYHEATAHFQRALIAQTLVSCRQNLGSTAERLGLSRHALRHQMAKLGLLASPGGNNEESE
ncbi:sigma-54 dependent transcriptional regulator [Cupriavidus basilensis]|uniref:Sigma-54 dependent transcriptional regulator n=1 Tax=Cupriavidus basilensis TaxID=68895 RepID=A0ABT6AUL2_9BURK|nr:sigma-54 dependent transcriptional regulator [Cupriavidus basilensis]MDF3836290.1 sigma-54 dependent transcriptional regulator [Cupriavidus basilensis]